MDEDLGGKLSSIGSIDSSIPQLVIPHIQMKALERKKAVVMEVQWRSAGIKTKIPGFHGPQCQ